MFQSLPSAIWFLPGSCQTPLSRFGSREGMPALSELVPVPVLLSRSDGTKGDPSPLTLMGPPAVPITALGGITEPTA